MTLNIKSNLKKLISNWVFENELNNRQWINCWTGWLNSACQDHPPPKETSKNISKVIKDTSKGCLLHSYFITKTSLVGIWWFTKSLPTRGVFFCPHCFDIKIWRIFPTRYRNDHIYTTQKKFPKKSQFFWLKKKTKFVHKNENKNCALQTLVLPSHKHNTTPCINTHPL